MEDYSAYDYRAPKKLASYAFFKKNERTITTKELSTNPKYSFMKKTCPYPRFTQICGGPNIYFPYAERFSALQVIAIDVEQKQVPFYNQIAYNAPGEGFRLCIDIDADKRVMTDEELIRMVAVLNDVLERYYIGKTIPLFVSTSGPKWRNGNQCLSVHIIAHVKVSLMEAKQIIYSYDLALQADDKTDMTGLKVDDGIYKDKSAKVAYESCNLRMIYSHKKEKCVNQEADEDHATCILCNGAKFIVSHKVYEPKFVYRNRQLDTEFFLQTHNNHETILRQHNLWVDETTDVLEGYQIPFGTLPYDTELKFEQEILQGKLPTTNAKKRKVPDEPVENTDMAKRFQNFIRKIMVNNKRPFEYIQVRCITEHKTPKNHQLNIFVKGLGAGHCLYMQKDHGDGRIFFQYDPKTLKLRLRCFSTKYEECSHQKDKKKCIEFVVDPWVHSGIDPKTLAPGTHNAERVVLTKPTRFVTTQILDRDTPLKTLMDLAFLNPHIIYKLGTK